MQYKTKYKNEILSVEIPEGEFDSGRFRYYTEATMESLARTALAREIGRRMLADGEGDPTKAATLVVCGHL